jgi:ElaB/YqjD/DUF883 family membrane-anchored ribosome-binding protein
MNETTDNAFATTASANIAGLNGNEGTVHRVAQKAHDAVDKIEKTLGTGSEKVMHLQQEYGDIARDQVRANPLTAVAGAFAVGVLFSKLFLR